MIKSLRMLAWMIFSFFILFLLILLLLQLPSVQTALTGKLTSWLREETGAVIEVERVAIRFPRSVGLKGIYIEEPGGDTLLHAGSIYAGIRMTALLRNRVYVRSLEIEDLTGFITREKPDTTFNFQFLADAFNNRNGNGTPSGEKNDPEQTGEDPLRKNETGGPPDDQEDRPFQLRINRVRLKNIDVHFADHHPGIRLRAELDHLQTTLDRSDLLNGKYHAGNIGIRGSRIILTGEEPSVPPPPADPEVPDIDISLASLELQDISFSHTNPAGNIMNIETDLLTLVPRNISLRDRLAEVSSLHAENLNTSILIAREGEHKADDLQEKSDKPENSGGFELRFPETMPWTVSLDNLELINSYFSIGEKNIPVPTDVFDPANFSIGNLNLSAQNIFVASESLRIDLSNLDMLVSEIFRLDNLDLDLNLGERSGTIDLKMQTAGSSIGLGFNMEANLLDFTMDDLTDRTMALVLEDTNIGEDLAFFVPLMNSYYFNRPDTGPVEIRSHITGSFANMTIDSLRIAGPDVFNVFLAGDVAGLPEIDSLFLDMEAIELWTATGVFFANIPEIQQPTGITLPEYILAEGQFRGTFREFETGMDISSDHGDLQLMAEMLEGPGEESSFKGRLFSGEFDIARLLQTDLFQQPLSLDLAFTGRGLEPELMELDAGLTIGQLLMMDYSYDDIAIDMTLRDSVVTIITSYTDEFLALDLNAGLGIFKEIITAEVGFTVDYAALDQLGMYGEEFFIGTDIEADIIIFPVDFFSGNIIVSNTNIALNGEIYNIPRMHIASDSQPGDYSLKLDSEFVTADYKGNFTPADIPKILSDHISEYFTIHDISVPPDLAEATDITEVTDNMENENADNPENAGAGNVNPGDTDNKGTKDSNIDNDDNGYAEDVNIDDENNGYAEDAKVEYVDNAGAKDVITEDAGDKYFDINLYLFPSDVISMVLLPAVEKYDTLSVVLSYNSQDQKFSLDAVINELQYSGMQFQNFKTIISSDPGKMDFGIFLQSLNINETNLYDFDLSGRLSDETLNFSFSFKDDEQQDIFLIGAQIESIEDSYNFQIDRENLILNYQNWKIPQDNLIVTGQEYLRFNNFILEHEGSMLSVESLDEDDYNNVTGISVRQLDIRSLTGFADDIIPLRGGILDGDLTIRNINDETSFSADLNITDLVWSDYKIDMISLQASDAVPGQINIEAVLEYQETTLRASGDFFPGEIPAVDMEVVMDHLDLQLIEAFAGDQVTNVSGDITGKLGIEGSIMSPEITGNINFTEAGFRIVELNTDYFLKEEQITFDRHNVRLQNFTLEDPQGRTANLSGNVNFENLDNLLLNLNFNTSNFMLMNLPQRRGGMYYGTILMDSELRIRGSHNNPSVGGRLRLNKGSAFTFVIPQTTPEAIGGEGVVEFISPEEEELFRKLIERQEPGELRSAYEIMNVTLNVELDKETELTVIIDEMAGDYLDLRGGGVLTFGIDPGGTISLTGRYDITGGEYRLSFHDVASRIFSIREGSNIIFTGDPMEAELDITAVHTVRTNAEQLLRSSVQGGQAPAGAVRRQYPFLVSLNMEGELMSPNISFGLDMPPEHRGALDGSIMARINTINENESELNKQVFALLILGSFIHENPFEAAAGPGISTTARSSASQILSQQLNRLSDRYVKGVDISFDLESYEVDREDEAVGRTELQVEVSRDFFNERVRVVVGGNIELEDETHRETRPGDIAGDFTLEYLITPRGDLIFRGFRKREYGDLIEGELTTTGVSLIFSRSYNRFRELFRREEEDNNAGIPLPDDEGDETEETVFPEDEETR